MLSMKAKYALRALMALTRHGKKTPIKTIAREADVPQKFLEAILLELKGHGLVDSKRGIFGGYYLIANPSDVSVGNLIRIVDGPLAPIRCASQSAYQKCEDCADEARCAIRKTMVEVRNAIAAVLDKKSIRDMADSEWS